MRLTIPFRPRLYGILKGYSARDFLPDLTAGLDVGIVALPLAMAFAIASGLKPEAGIFTAVIAGFIISAFGGTKVCIGGPTGAFIVILYGIGVKYGLDNLAICTVMAGVFLLVMGLARLRDDQKTSMKVTWKTIVKQFLRLAGPSALDLAPVEVSKSVAHVCKLLQPEAAARQIEIVTQVADDLPPVIADADQLIQALLNLVINALQAVKQNGRVELRVQRSGNALIIEVRDTGAGVPQEKLSAIFEPYYTTKSEGSGIGLWIAQQIITAHRGTIQAANAPTGGAVFTIHLPLQLKEKPNG